MTEVHVELPGSRRPVKHGARRVRDIDPQARVDVTVTLSGPDLPAVDEAGVAIGYAAFSQHLGVAPATVQTVEAVLARFGLSVDGVTQGGRSLRVSGSAGAMEAAFRPELAIYHNADQGDFRGRAGALCLPAELDGLVSGVFGLDQRRVARRRSHANASATGHSVGNGRAGAPLSPADLEKRYNFVPGDAAGQVVAIAEFGAPAQEGGRAVPPAYLPGDVAAFCRQQHRPSPKVQLVSVNLAPLTLEQLQALPAAQQNAAADETGEVMMDVEIVAALCPAATINVYFATFDQKGWIDLLDDITAAHPEQPVAVSISWGEAEDSPDWSQAGLREIDRRLQAAALQGITICVSAGDDGSGDGMPGRRAHVDFPASSPFVLAVGGTMLDSAGQEVAWWQSPGRRSSKGGGATGGGVSTLFPRPSWQTVGVRSINAGSIDGRVVPDVSALAGPPYYELILDGRSAPNGGTSASAPLWASLIARMNAHLPVPLRQRFLTAQLYGHDIGKTGCRDVASGNNASHPQPGKGYSAMPGYDAVTGWGVPDGRALLFALGARPAA